MAFLSRHQYGHAVFLRAFAGLPIPSAVRVAAVARWLGVTPATVRAWIAGRRCPPRATVYALWLESADGRAATSLQVYNELRTYAALARALQDAERGHLAVIDALRSELAAVKSAQSGATSPGAANDSRFLDCAPAPVLRPRVP